MNLNFSMENGPTIDPFKKSFLETRSKKLENRANSNLFSFVRKRLGQ
jgi:hypothetical protein